MKAYNSVIPKIRSNSLFTNILPNYVSKVSKRYHHSSSSSNSDKDTELMPIPLFIINNLSKESVKSFINELVNKGGVYSFMNTINGRQYIGSAKDLYLRLNEHLDNPGPPAADRG